MCPENEGDRPEKAIQKNDEKKNRTRKTSKNPSVKKGNKGKKVFLKKNENKKTSEKTGENALLNFADKTTHLLDYLFDEIKELLKKISEWSKNSNLMEPFSKIVQKTGQWIIRKKDEFSKIHKLNTSIASSKRQLEHHTLNLGNKVVELIEDQKIDPTLSNGLDYLFTHIKDLKQEIAVREEELKKILKD